MKQIGAILLLSFFIITAFAQEVVPNKLIKGKVVDSATNQPVAYTNIGLEGTYYGTASDIDGNYELKVPPEFFDRNIYFSAVGYSISKLPVFKLFEKDFNLIKLTEQSYSISNIDINAQSKVIYRILRTASDDIAKNFATGPFNTVCNYTFEKTTVDTIYFRKATVDIYDKTGYATPSKLDAFKNRNYKFSSVTKNFESYSFFEGSTNIDELLDLDFARSVSSILNQSLLSGFELTMEEETKIENTTAWVIGFKTYNPTYEISGDFYASRFEGKIYIAKNDYSVIKIEGWAMAPKQSKINRGLALAPDTRNFVTDVAYDFSVEYNSESVKFIKLNKNYTDDGNPVKEQTSLVVQATETTGITPIVSRQYFEGN